MIFHESPSITGISTATAKACNVTINQILRGKDNIYCAIWKNTESVWKNFTDSKSPSRAAISLIKDWMNARRPFLSSVKSRWDLQVV
ncbi:unnamed protein product [Blepharisma stoltei]|uniref:Uncharacterized protein n=1 Tax=Blepharisma stoltei TaxID=1481888 RepID=A0AAU9IL68_9CILI|nr:unnamed protein product [Blepharisma stoltei]